MVDVFETLQLDDTVLIKPLGFTGKIVGLAFYTYHVPQILVEYVDFQRELVRGWYNVSHVKKQSPDAENNLKDNVVPLKK